MICDFKTLSPPTAHIDDKTTSVQLSRSGRIFGSKVSKIANLFDQQQFDLVESSLASSSTATLTPHDSHQPQTPTVTVVRTESHVARFNNARALFEKLGEKTTSNTTSPIPVEVKKRSNSKISTSPTPVPASRITSAKTVSVQCNFFLFKLFFYFVCPK